MKLNNQFKLPKSVKRMMASSCRTKEDRGIFKRAMISAVWASQQKPVKELKGKRNESISNDSGE